MKRILILLSISLLTITMVTKNVVSIQGEDNSEIVATTTEPTAIEETNTVDETTVGEETTQAVEIQAEQPDLPAGDEEGSEAELPAEEDSEKNIVEEEPSEISDGESGEDETAGELPEAELSEMVDGESEEASSEGEGETTGELPEGELPEGELPEGENNESNLEETEQDLLNAPLTAMVGAGNPLTAMVGAGNPTTQSEDTSKKLVIRADDVFVINADGWEIDGDVYYKKQERFSQTPMSPSIDIISEDLLKEKNKYYSYDSDVSYTYKDLETGEEIDEPYLPGSYEKIAKVTVKYKYLLLRDSYNLKTSVKFRIDGIKVVDITNDETVTYTGDVVIPNLYSTDTGKHTKTLEYGKDYYLTKTLLGGRVDSVNASDDSYYAYAVFTQEFRNEHWSFDWSADRDLFVQRISYKIVPRDVHVTNTKEFVYNKGYQTPDVFVFDKDANSIEVTKGEGKDYNIINVTKKNGTSIDSGNPMDVGNYTAEVVFSPEFLGNNNVVEDRAISKLDNGNYKIKYEITKKIIEFAGWDAGTAESNGKVFNWVGDANDAKLEFNGYNPTLFNGFTKANFVGLDGEAIADENLTYTVIPTSLLDGIGHHLVNINLTNNNYKLVGEGNFTIVQKPVMIKWENTVIDVKALHKVPNAKIVEINNPELSGVVATDEGKVFIDYDYYRIINGYPVKVLLPPTEEGDYIVEAKVYNKALVPTLCVNYSYGDTYQTRYQIVDMSTSHTGDINTGTISKLEEDATLDLLGFNEDQAEAFVENLPNEEIREILTEALEKHKDINLYIVAENADGSGLTLPDGVSEDEAICIDIQLFATVEGDTNKYQIEDTGAYPVSILFTLTPEEAEKIGYNPNRIFCVARYHGDTANPVVSQETPIIDGDGNFQFVYESSKFSDFVIYTKDKPVAPVVASVERKNSHAVINTGD